MVTSREKSTSVKNWPEEERPRERLLRYGPGALSDAQLLAILIGSGEGGRSAVDVGRELMARFGSLSALEQAGVQELRAVRGIGPARAAELKAALELGRRFQGLSAAGEDRAAFCSSGSVARYYRSKLKDLKKEQFQCVLLDTKNRLIREELVSIGSLTASIVHPRDTFKAAVRESAAAVIFVHNHPSGDTRPSQEDILLTRRLAQAGDLLGIRVLDHIIVGDREYYSFRDSGLLSPEP